MNNNNNNNNNNNVGVHSIAGTTVAADDDLLFLYCFSIVYLSINFFPFTRSPIAFVPFRCEFFFKRGTNVQIASRLGRTLFLLSQPQDILPN